MPKPITPEDVKNWIHHATPGEIDDFLECGLAALIEELEGDDQFGTEGFNKRFA